MAGWQDDTGRADRAALEATPEAVLSACEGLVIIDEVQRLPDLFPMLRPLCDAPDRKAVFLLLGSASWDLVQGGIRDPRGSRPVRPRCRLLPWRGGRGEPGSAVVLRRLSAGLSGGVGRGLGTLREAFAETVLERGIPGIGSRVAPSALGRFWRMLARSMDVSTTAVNHYCDLLEGTFMVRVLPPWFENLGKRQVKSPKVYLRDSGILHYLLGLGHLLELQTHPRYGPSWEGFALEQTLIRFGERDAYFWATQRGAELDLLLLRHGRRFGFEYTCTDAPATSRSMHIARTDLGLAHLWVVYPGRRRYPRGDGITALPLAELPALQLEPPR